MTLRILPWGTGVVFLFAAAASHAATIAVPAGGDFQAALDAAQPGDVITLEPGATYTGNFVPLLQVQAQPLKIGGLPAPKNQFADLPLLFNFSSSERCQSDELPETRRNPGDGFAQAWGQWPGRSSFA